jgi:hypothetical protein
VLERQSDMASSDETYLQRVERLIAEYPDLPHEAIFKEDILRTGLAFSPEALALAAGHKPKAYFIFSFDMLPLSEMQGGEGWKAPEEIRLLNGPYAFRPAIVSVRVNPRSPYRVIVSEEKTYLQLEGARICQVEYPALPDYYRRQLASGKPVTDICPTIEWGYLLYLTVFRLCQYFGAQEECQFCDINENYRQQKKAGRPYTGVKSVEEVLEALEIIAETDSDSRAYTVTGGSITSKLDGQTEAEFYGKYPAAIEQRFPSRWISKLVVQALPRDDVQRFKDCGVSIYHPNYEIWDQRLFEILCAGKARYIGREQWIRRILDAAEVFGPDRVIPNFVAGVEMAAPHGFERVDDALRSTGEGLDFFMSHGVSPRFTTWCPEPLSVLGRNQGGAPLDYHVGLLQVWRDTHEKYRLMAPPGYGNPGIGRSVFSVSAFMDVIRLDRGVPINILHG